MSEVSIMEMKGALFCSCTCLSDWSFNECCSFADSVFHSTGYSISRFAFSAVTEAGKEKRYSYVYSTKRIELYQHFKWHDFINTISFMAIVRANKKEETVAMLNMFKHRDGRVQLTLSWNLDHSIPEKFIDTVSFIQDKVRELFHIRFLLADWMAKNKDVELFLGGIQTAGATARTDAENAIAERISTSEFRDFRIPYLFSYNYFPEISNVQSIGTDRENTIVFPDLFCRPFEAYCDNSEWLKCYTNLENDTQLCERTGDGSVS